MDLVVPSYVSIRMYRRKPHHQLSFEDFFLPFGGKLCGDNR
jgi:hypothetical protein